MKSLRLLALVPLACACTASAVLACDAHKTANATKAGSTTTANAVVASANGQVPVVPAEGGCSAQAMQSGCSAKGTATTAVTASTAGKSCAHGNKSAMVNGDHCSAKGASTASMAVVGAGMRCTAHQNGIVHDCAACEDWMEIDQDAHALGARSQVVALKNGAMIVYTADSPASVKALQAMVAKRNERMTAVFAGNSDAKLCEDCKALRGAMASGKLNREVVNVERGVMALITSNDRAVVQRIRTMTGQPLAMR